MASATGNIAEAVRRVRGTLQKLVARPSKLGWGADEMAGVGLQKKGSKDSAKCAAVKVTPTKKRGADDAKKGRGGRKRGRPSSHQSIKPLHRVGSEVYAAWWPSKSRTTIPSYYPAVVTYHKNGSVSDGRYGSVRYYNVRYDDGHTLDHLPDHYVYSAKDYLLSEGREKDSWLGVKNVTDKTSTDLWARNVGWWVASIDGEKKMFSLLWEALRGYDSSVIRKKGLGTKESELNIPEDLFGQDYSDSDVQETKPKPSPVTKKPSALGGQKRRAAAQEMGEQGQTKKRKYRFHCKHEHGCPYVAVKKGGLCWRHLAEQQIAFKGSSAELQQNYEPVITTSLAESTGNVSSSMNSWLSSRAGRSGLAVNNTNHFMEQQRPSSHNASTEQNHQLCSWEGCNNNTSAGRDRCPRHKRCSVKECPSLGVKAGGLCHKHFKERPSCNNASPEQKRHLCSWEGCNNNTPAGSYRCWRHICCSVKGCSSFSARKGGFCQKHFKERHRIILTVGARGLIETAFETIARSIDDNGTEQEQTKAPDVVISSADSFFSVSTVDTKDKADDPHIIRVKNTGDIAEPQRRPSNISFPEQK